MKLEDYCTDLVMMPSLHKENAIELLVALAPFEERWIEAGGKPWKITSGYRFMDEHVRIYRDINERRKKAKLKPIPIPMRSNHLFGNAVDIADPDGKLKEFIRKHEWLAEEREIYFEHFDYTNGYVHMQRVAPLSGVRYFRPYALKPKTK